MQQSQDGGILRFLLPQPFIRQGAPHSEKGAEESYLSFVLEATWRTERKPQQ